MLSNMPWSRDCDQNSSNWTTEHANGAKFRCFSPYKESVIRGTRAKAEYHRALSPVSGGGKGKAWSCDSTRHPCQIPRMATVASGTAS